MQSVDTDRVKLDDHCWSVECANCSKRFEATRSDASYCSPRCRKQASTGARRKQAAIAELARIARRTSAISSDFRGSQDVFDQMTALHKAIGKQLAWFEIEWKPKNLPGITVDEIKPDDPESWLNL